MAACQVRFGVPFETSKTSRSVVLAVSSSTIKKLREYIILKVFLLRSLRKLLNRQRDQNQNQDSATAGTNCRLRNPQPPGWWVPDLSAWRSFRSPLRNNPLPGQQSSQELLRV